MSDERESEYTKVLSSFHKGPVGSGWSLSLVDDEGCGPGVTLNYHKVGHPNKNMFTEEMSIHDVIRLKNFCEMAINALVTPRK